MDSNVAAEMINVDQSEISPDVEAMKFLNFWEIKSFPAAVMVAPDGRSLVLPISSVASRETSWSLLESAVLSPKREEIMSSVVNTYCAVLLIQGVEASENRKAEKAIKEAVDELSEIMTQMPNPVEEPPRVIVVPRKLFSQERILLWSLGVKIKDESDAKPYMAVIYGRGRHIGPILAGAEITKNKVLNIISVIGESCECDLDRALMLGTMIPLRWGEKTQTELAKLLGFDVDSPMVKTEMVQILSSGSSINNTVNPFAGYRETVVEFENEERSPVVTPAQLTTLRDPSQANTNKSKILPSYQMALFIVCVAVLVVVAAGAFVVLRARRRVS